MPNDNPDFRIQLDACQPGVDDLERDEMRPLAEQLANDSALKAVWDRSQRWDAAVRGGLRQVPVPVGLADRLLAGVTLCDTAVANDGGLVCPAPRSRRFPRRMSLALAGVSLAAVAAAALLLIAFLPTPTGVVTARSLDQEIPRWTASIQPQLWQDKEFPVRQFPPSAAVPLQLCRWQPLPKSLTGVDPVVCYDLAPPGKGFVRLFVMNTQRRIELPNRPTLPTRDTQQLSVGFWKDDRNRGIVYVLAVEGNSQRFRNIVLRPQIAQFVPLGNHCGVRG